MDVLELCDQYIEGSKQAAREYQSMKLRAEGAVMALEQLKREILASEEAEAEAEAEVAE